MAQLGQTFNAKENVDEDARDGDFPVLPAGWQNAIATESSVDRNSKDTGDIMKFRFDIVDGQYQNRVIWCNLNYIHENPITQRIARGHLSQFCEAVGVVDLQNTEELHGKPVAIKLKQVPAKDGYEAKNDITAFKKAGAADVTQPAQAATSESAPW